MIQACYHEKNVQGITKGLGGGITLVGAQKKVFTEMFEICLEDRKV